MNWFYRVCLISLALVLSACGGGGGGGCDAQWAVGGAANCSNTSGSSATGSAQTTVSGYTAAVSTGELIDSNWDSTYTQVKYSFVESLSGYTRDAQVRQIPVSYSTSEKTYSTPSFVGKYANHSSGLMFGMISERYGSTSASTSPFFGVLSLQTNAVSRQDTYNVIGNLCTTVSSCTAYHGTFRFNPDGTWDWCKGGNLYNPSSTCNATESGVTDISSSTGRITLRLSNQVVIGNAIFTSKNVQKVLVIQFNGNSSTARSGMLVGVARANAPTATLVNGNWNFTAATQSGSWLVADQSPVSATVKDVTQTIDGTAGTTALTMTLNNPWTGLSTLSTGDIVLMAESGVFATSGASTGLRLGLKKE